MKILKFSLGPLQTNTYLLLKDNEALIVDPSFTTQNEFLEIQKHLEGHQLQGIVLTHGHIDHIAGIPLILHWQEVPIYINSKEAYFLKDANYNLSNMIPPILTIDASTQPLNSGLNSIGGFQFEVLNTPGHTAGSQSFVFDNDILCGDFIFAGSVGRMDFPTGSERVMMNSIVEFVQRFRNHNVTLYPGHGDTTSLKNELLSNMYVHHALNS